MSTPPAPRRKPSLLADRAPERRRTRRNESGSRTGKAFFRPRPSVTTSDFIDADFVPGYN